MSAEDQSAPREPSGHEQSVVVHDRGAAVEQTDAFENPGLPPHRPRQTDLHPHKERRAERQVVGWFLLSMLGSVLAIVAYIAVPIELGNMASVRANNLFLGLAIALALLGIGIGAMHWARQLMSSHEVVEERHLTRGSEPSRARAVEIFQLGDEESGFSRRSLIRNTLIGAIALVPLPAVILFRDLAPAQDAVEAIAHTMWRPGMRLALDPSGAPIKATDVTQGSAFHVIPEPLTEIGHNEGYLDQKALAAVLLVRLPPERLFEEPGREGWSYDGIVAYSKICTHVGCPVALYEQQTHHLLCPCHQSTFDVSHHAKVVFGPAKRALPQLPITVDDEGYLVAQRDFTEPIGASFFERLHHVDPEHVPLSAAETENRA
ncbi:menaquinol-cytochrome c reductase iron-sulfur subunit precursor [Agrococcus baldri]|uniref:Cytochrome bc1 complex Rieske iron-sulfur subunit n=1 Tax=Agrococcus baldri TaxID=153730 RepID=A0AA94HP76_9MICO|nr:Rieske 2Fe-2S domain-containing protein [Agrococcus baldri]SFS18068.1 menaquinol-cytochrome c reductase iron-sulfur subunit precursor [Agrococcus baldri]